MDPMETPDVLSPDVVTSDVVTSDAPEAALTGDRGIDVLVDLAKAGQIDPWNIDIIDVTDKYLRTLDVTKEADLRLSGRALFYAAVLLRLKSEALEEVDEEAVNGFEDDHLDYDEDDGGMVIRPAMNILDRAIARRTSAKQPRKRPTTLVELIAELQRLEQLEREGAMERVGAMRRDRQVNETTEQMVERLVHTEDLEGDVGRLEVLLTEWLTAGNALTLSELFEYHSDPRGTFLALLFLDARGKINLIQEELYHGDIAITPENLIAHGQDRAA
ncbi:segregation and condensation protein A [compost metagenome]